MLAALLMLFILLIQHTVYNEMLTQGNLTFVVSILEICSIELGEGGDYTCNATNGFINEIIFTVIDNRGECVYLCLCVCVLCMCVSMYSYVMCVH